MLAMILRDYSIHLPEDCDGGFKSLRSPGETETQKLERVLKVRSHITLTPEHKPLVFKRRNARSRPASSA